MEVNGHLRSREVKGREVCKKDISRRRIFLNFKFGMFEALGKQLTPIVFPGGQRSFDVERSQGLKTL